MWKRKTYSLLGAILITATSASASVNFTETPFIGLKLELCLPLDFTYLHERVSRELTAAYRSEGAAWNYGLEAWQYPTDKLPELLEKYQLFQQAEQVRRELGNPILVCQTLS